MKIFRILCLGAFLALDSMVATGCAPMETSYDFEDVFAEDGKNQTNTDMLPPHKVRARKNKKSSWSTYDAYTIDRFQREDGSVFDPEAGSEPQKDKYGGWKIMSRAATGFFRTEKIGDRWWFVTPDGNIFLSNAVAVFTLGNSERQQQNLKDKFGTLDNWAKAETGSLKSLGFNSLGAWSSVNHVRRLEEPMPYTVIVSPMAALISYMKQQGEETNGFNAAGWEGYPYDFAMVFHPKFDEFVESEVSKIQTYKNDPYCLGYFTDNEIPWKDYALDNCLTKWPSSHINHQKAQEWLDQRKGKKGAKLSEATEQDKKAFIAYCFEVYLQKVSAALRMYDSNHLYLGCRYNQWTHEMDNDELNKVAGKYFDVISLNHYQKWQPDQTALRNLHTWSDKPLMITEFYVKGEDSSLPNETGAGWNVQTQTDRGYFYQNFVNELIKSKVCVGWHWFTYRDNDPEDLTTDPSNRDSNKGIVTWDLVYYTALTGQMKLFNDNVYELTRFYDQK